MRNMETSEEFIFGAPGFSDLLLVKRFGEREKTPGI